MYMYTKMPPGIAEIATQQQFKNHLCEAKF